MANRVKDRLAEYPNKNVCRRDSIPSYLVALIP